MLTGKPLDKQQFPSEHFMALAGSVVEDARESVSGYEGTARRAVWVGFTLPLEGKQRPSMRSILDLL